MNSVVNNILKAHPHQTKSFYVSSPKIVEDLIDQWTILFPRVTPHYAVKCNNDEVLLKTMCDKNVNFDCASSSEIKKVIQIGVSPSRIIFAHTMKTIDDLIFAKDQGVDIATFDSSFELDKIHTYHPNCKMILRIRCDDPNAAVQLGNKFGANEDEIRHLLEYAKQLDIEVIGISFHVGSGSRNPEAYYRAIKSSKEAFNEAISVGHKPYILDIGGGLHADIDEGELSTYMSDYINDAIKDFFPEDTVTIVAEPGRFFAEHYSVLATQVIGKRVRDGLYEYFFNESTYGGFSNVIFEKSVPTPQLLRDVPDDEEYVPSVLYGCTCDGVDVINHNVALPELHIGDWVYFPSWGAYTNVLTTSFNGFGEYDVYYI
uniref:A207R protein, arginine decarboxylase n=1 Tax=Paramecium bursaria Chlorella virus 1 TaxID=10506 RepID=UPI0000F53423|nr:Chain A, A207R protein, arginine decarboxylase [Paramecium bursaria Chlorella virus 1]2NV9_B Chain B, A207R protein, arginine decarboxylase [Paramecium bursaria Chlorella virus 1]2NV9_C Chain C, A207R protein, arginine decarboxylase [Paramecium bursaria Chlorella virus 1]2NV9_D Chain D, A207R protein, arginine decarboxylase [Paramecium bursaria Chlorella virus 1]2NV9_E Chain E, A207R protein, arginine decarboxylase [Paramecium bursaria Chlorella virus 1]2NV9_F Chain F, A207R protein, argini